MQTEYKYEFELATTFDFASKLKSALEEEIFGLSALTPLASPVPSRCGSPQPATHPSATLNNKEASFGRLPLASLPNLSPSGCTSQQFSSHIPTTPPRLDFVDVLCASTLPIKRAAIGSPDVSPATSPSKFKGTQATGTCKTEGSRGNKRKRLMEAVTNPEQRFDDEGQAPRSTKRERRRAHRKDKRQREMVKAVTDTVQGAYGLTKHVGSSIRLEVEMNLKDSRVASTGYTGLDDKIRTRSSVALEDLISGKHVGRKFTLRRWDATQVLSMFGFQSRV